MAAIQIERAVPDDLPTVLQLLATCDLPAAGLAEHFSMALVARQVSQIVGAAAIEIHAGGGLLRSVAVHPTLQGQGIGVQLIAAALHLARECQITDLYLLTETAAQYFPRFGFAPVTRQAVPVSVQSSIEFTTVCPASATVMHLHLQQNQV